MATTETEKIHPELAEITLRVQLIFGRYKVDRQYIKGWVDYFRETGGDPESPVDTEVTKSTFRLLFGSMSEIQVILYKEVVTIHPLMIEDIHMEAWAEVVNQYGNQVVLLDHSKEAFLT